jgi:dTMP kinase
MPFITFEGMEGCGKSTQAKLLARALGPDAVLTQEPGGTAIGRAIRQLLLDPANRAMSAEAEVLLFFADRAQHVAEVIRPALAAGKTVISTRYVDTSLAYQGYGRGLDLDRIRAVAVLATGGLRPDLTLFFDLPLEIGLARVVRRGGRDRLESEVREFHERVRNGYLELAAQEPDRWIRIDASGSEADVEARTRAAVEARGLAPSHGVR